MLYHKREVAQVQTPMYDELEVKNLWPLFKEDKHFAMYFPDYREHGRIPDRNYFFAVLNTFNRDYYA